MQTDQKRNSKPKAPPQYTVENKQITAAWSNINENVVKNKKNQELGCYGNPINTHDEALPYIVLGNKCAIFKDINSEAVSDKVSNLGAVSNNPQEDFKSELNSIDAELSKYDKEKSVLGKNPSLTRASFNPNLPSLMNHVTLIYQLGFFIFFEPIPARVNASPLQFHKLPS